MIAPQDSYRCFRASLQGKRFRDVKFHNTKYAVHLTQDFQDRASVGSNIPTFYIPSHFWRRTRVLCSVCQDHELGP